MHEHPRPANWIVAQRLSYSVGFTLPDTVVDELAKVPERECQPAYDPRPGAPQRSLGARSVATIESAHLPAFDCVLHRMRTLQVTTD
jgi:hypothetical protein